ncbi:transcription factor bHLH143 [Ricinus communis]|uniref:transcription factor bHLH143 n=1 Tax=Ricinus communis TaxID=3988 RepID=UPI00201A67C7|nr:transcription factor bHLH143 [Ricinus communis]
MVKANNSWLFPPHETWELSDFNCMSTSLEPVQPGCLPAFVSHGTPTNMMMPRISVPTYPSLRTQQSIGAQGLPQSKAPPFHQVLPAIDSYPKESLPAFNYGFSGESALNAVPACQRKFVIFDQSGNETKLIYSSFFPTGAKPTIAASRPTAGSYLRSEEHAAKLDGINLIMPKLQEVSDENYFSGEESEMHEDTEEIDALLYSDDNDDDYDDDEVISTGHSPSLIRNYGMQGQVEEITEEVTDSAGQNKRQKLLDGGYKRSSLTDTASSTKVAMAHGYDCDDAESSCAIGQNHKELRLAILGKEQLKKDKIRSTLKILESIIPGVKDKDPLLVLDVAIDYLKSLKLSAKTLGVNYS